MQDSLHRHTAHRYGFRAPLWCALLWALAAGPAGADRPAGTAAGRAPLGPVAGEVIVKFKPGAALTRQYALNARSEAPAVRNALADRAAAMGARLGRPLQAGAAVGPDTQVLRAEGISAAELAAKLAADPDVEFAEPNERMRRTAAPNDPLYPALAAGVRPRGPDSGQWYLRAPAATVAQGPVSSIDIEAAWLRTRGSASVVVAVLDTGVRPDHPDLAGRLLPGYDFVADADVGNDSDGRDADASDPGDWTTAAENSNTTGKFHKCDPGGTGAAVGSASSWHGTSTTSLVGAKTDDATGMAGAAPGVQLLPVRVLGKCFGNSSDIQAAMRWAAGIPVPGVPDNPNPAKVLNLSLGGSSATCSAGYQNAVNEVLARGVVIVAAAGNSAGGPVGSPANCPGVIAVAGLRHAGTKVGFSDLGTQIAIAAPAGNCVNTSGPCVYPMLAATNSGTEAPAASGWTDSFRISVGTSFASPLVAATAGLMFSAQPALTPAQLLTQMQATARPFPTTGGDNGDGNAVPQCVAPRAGVDQLQCYCNTSFCGAGMLDAGRAVAAAAGALARIGVTPGSPAAGSPVELSAGTSVAGEGAAVVGYQWVLTDGGGIVTAFSSATNASTATLTPTAAGSFTVTLTITDSRNNVATATQTVTVSAAATVAPPPVAPTDGGGGGGGGSMSPLWLAALAAAVLALFRCAAPRLARPARPERHTA